MEVCFGSPEMSFLVTSMLAFLERSCPYRHQEPVENNDLEQLPVRHNVSQKDASENNDVTSYVAVEVGKDSRQIDTSHINEF